MAARMLGFSLRSARLWSQARTCCLPVRCFSSTWKTPVTGKPLPDCYLGRLSVTPLHQNLSRLSTSSPVFAQDHNTATELLQTEVIDKASVLTEPTFQSLGIGGYNPIGIFQELLQFVHVNMGFSWLATIVASTVFVKVLLFPLSLNEVWRRRKLQALQPVIQQITGEMNNARKHGDEVTMAEMSNQLSQLYKKHKCHPGKSLINQTAQLSTFVFFLLAIKGLADVPVESLRTGGMLWFPDLLVADPLYILPVACSAMLTLKIGHDLKMPLWKSSILVFPCTSYILALVPAAGVVYATTSVSLFILETELLRSKFIQRKLKLPPVLQMQANAGSTGFVQEFKDGFWSARSKAKLEARKSQEQFQKPDKQSEEMFENVRNRARKDGVKWKRRRVGVRKENRKEE